MVTSAGIAVWPTWYFTFRHLAMKCWTCSKHGAKAEHKCNVQAHKCKVEELMQRLSPPRLASPPHTGQTPWEPVSGSKPRHAWPRAGGAPPSGRQQQTEAPEAQQQAQAGQGPLPQQHPGSIPASGSTAQPPTLSD